VSRMRSPRLPRSSKRVDSMQRRPSSKCGGEVAANRARGEQSRKDLVDTYQESQTLELSRGRSRMREIARVPIGRLRGASEYSMTRRIVYKFRLYTADDTQNSAQALANHNRAVPRISAGSTRDRSCRCVSRAAACARGRHPLDTDTSQASPLPVHIVGTLSQTQRLLQMLGLDAVSAMSSKQGPAQRRELRNSPY